jgi:hypothetical protein
MRLDLDLQPLAQDARFADLLQRVHALRVAERLDPAPLRADGWPLVAMDLERRVPELLERHRIPGAAIAVIQGGEVVWAAGFGLRHRGEPSPMTPAARFPLRAPGRLLTVAAVLEEQRAGRLQLEQVLAMLDEPPSAAAHGGPTPLTVRLPTVGAGRRAPGKAAGDPYSMMQMLVELSSQQSFVDYWRRRLPEATEAFGTAGDEGDIVTGHSLFGTPFPQVGQVGRTVTVDGLAHVMGSVMTAFGTGADAAAAAFLLERMARLEHRGAIDLGLALRAVNTPAGPQLRIDEERRGLGCVVRCYPEAELGVVVLYNGEDGGDAARRIAHVAIGGWE